MHLLGYPKNVQKETKGVIIETVLKIMPDGVICRLGLLNTPFDYV